MKESKPTFLDKDTYLLPWNEKDNPNGWVEPTTYCQLKCPGCYRGLDKDNPRYIHEDILDMKQQIDKFVVTRNIQTLSIAGGEPLLYPQLEELVVYASKKNLRIMIYTNGVALNEEKLISLKSWGVNQVVLHIDKYQRRNNYKDENDLLELRKEYCQLFRKVGGVGLGFIQPISKDNLEDIDILYPFYKKNIDIVNLIVFTLYREVDWDHSIKASINTNIKVKDIVKEIKKDNKYKPCCYLGSTNNIKDPTWLFSISAGTPKYHYGFLDGRIYKFIQTRYRQNKGKFLFITKYHNTSIIRLSYYLFFSCIRKIFISFLKKNKFKSLSKDSLIYWQTLLILRGPEKNQQKWDLCQGCPDAMYYQGELVPSCILEEIKKST